MSTKKSTILLSAFAFITLLIFSITSCQRDINDLTDQQPDTPDIPIDFSKLAKKNGFLIQNNLEVPTILLDKNGNEIQRRPHSSARLMDTPDAICEDPASAEVSTALQYTENTVSDCINQTHTITVYWRIKSSFDLALANPSPPNQASRGRLRIKNGTTITYSDLNINLVSGNIVYVGTDPVDPTLKIYDITFSKTGIPHTYLTGGNFTAIEVSLAVYSDCDDPYDSYSIITAYVQAYAPTVGLNVCERNDNININPSYTGAPPPSNDMCGSVVGSWVAGSPGACENYDANLGTQIQVKRAGDPDINYRDLHIKVNGAGSWRTDGIVHFSEIVYFRQLQDIVINPPSPWPVTNPPTTYNFTFRWRNVDGTGTSSPFTITCRTSWWHPEVTLPIYDF